MAPPSAATTWCWPWAPSRTSSTPRARRPTPSLCTSWSRRERLRSRLLHTFEDVDNDHSLIDQGALNYVIIGAGATGVETAGRPGRPDQRDPAERNCPGVPARADLHRRPGAGRPRAVLRSRPRLRVQGAREKHVELKLGLSATEIRPDRVVLSDGSEILTRTVVWAGGIQAAAARGPLRAPTRPRRPDRRASRPDRRRASTASTCSETSPTPSARRQAVSPARVGGPASGRVGRGRTSSPTSTARPRSDFKYHDKGIMAMIGRNAAVAEMGKRRHELHGAIAFAAGSACTPGCSPGPASASTPSSRGDGTTSPRPEARPSSTTPTKARSTGEMPTRGSRPATPLNANSSIRPPVRTGRRPIGVRP